MISQYKNLSEKYRKEFDRMKKLYTMIAVVRLIIITGLIFAIGKYISTAHTIYLWSGITLLILFLLLLQFHQKIRYQRNIQQKLFEINEEEIAYLTLTQLPFEDGNEFIDAQHLYSFDLDVFGRKSLFHHLNRTGTPIGKQKLADKLKFKLRNDDIPFHQQTIKEISEKVTFRQLFLAKAKLAQLSQPGLELLLKWSRQNVSLPHFLFTLLKYFMPGLFVFMACLSFYSENILYTYLTNTCFLLNLCLFTLFFKKIKGELIEADKIHQSLEQYAQILEMISTEPASSEYLNDLKNQLKDDDKFAHTNVLELSKLFRQLSSLENPVGAVLFNGALLYHLGVYYQIIAWKHQKAHLLEKYLLVLGEIDALNSLANFACNNSDFVFPEINHHHHIEFKKCGHPLIESSKRICNDVNFEEHSFMILTGSNMSGKSTFLRTLGINMLLTNTGAPVCAQSANVHPLFVIVSMRLNDSLNDGESYFFAEVKRLKQLMQELEQQNCFVLLDEILKGTNSDDKRLGTVKVIEKMVQKNAVGVIATHDLEVCNITESYPDKLNNYCFEVEIVNNELYFDYTLKKGICKNKSATFLMTKMEVI